MKKINTLMFIALIAMSSSLIGQNIVKLDVKGYHTKFAGNDNILVSTDSYNGVKAVDLETNKETVLSDAPKSGKAIYLDGKVVFGDKLSATSINIDGSGKKTIEKSKKTSLRQAAFQMNDKSSKKSSSELIAANSIDKLTAIELVYADGSSKIIKPLGKGAQYLQTEISPNGKFIIVKQYGGNGYLMSNKGDMIVDLGYMERPTWAGNEFVAFQITKDNGDNITSSDIYTVGINSRVRTNLTSKFSKIAMEPSSNSDGSKIVFNTDEGEIYLINK